MGFRISSASIVTALEWHTVFMSALGIWSIGSMALNHLLLQNLYRKRSSWCSQSNIPDPTYVANLRFSGIHFRAKFTRNFLPFALGIEFPWSLAFRDLPELYFFRIRIAFLHTHTCGFHSESSESRPWICKGVSTNQSHLFRVINPKTHPGCPPKGDYGEDQPLQRAYQKGRFTETTVHKVVITVKRSLHCNQYTLAVLLNMKGALTNVSTKAHKKALIRIGLQGCLMHWIVFMLRTKIIQSDLSIIQLIGVVNRGWLHLPGALIDSGRIQRGSVVSRRLGDFSASNVSHHYEWNGGVPIDCRIRTQHNSSQNGSAGI